MTARTSKRIEYTCIALALGCLIPIWFSPHAAIFGIIGSIFGLLANYLQNKRRIR